MIVAPLNEIPKRIHGEHADAVRWIAGAGAVPMAAGTGPISRKNQCFTLFRFPKIPDFHALFQKKPLKKKTLFVILRQIRRKLMLIQNDTLMKLVYEKPQTELYIVKFEGSLLQGSAEKMRSVTGSWDEDDE